MKTKHIPQGSLVEIQPMTVNIQVISVNNKQMTQSVFKQLPEKRCFNDQEDFLGNWWGRVNYQFGDYKEGFWMVFELDGVLYKDWFSTLRLKKEKAQKQLGKAVMVVIALTHPISYTRPDILHSFYFPVESMKISLDLAKLYFDITVEEISSPKLQFSIHSDNNLELYVGTLNLRSSFISDKSCESEFDYISHFSRLDKKSFYIRLYPSSLNQFEITLMRKVDDRINTEVIVDDIRYLTELIHKEDSRYNHALSLPQLFIAV